MLDFSEFTRPSTPNTYLLCAPDICRAAQADAPPLAFAHSAEAVRDAILALEPQAAFSGGDGGSIQGAYVAVTPLLRFKDDVDVLIVPDGTGGCRVAVYSRSRVGHSDLGANKKRVNLLARRIAERLDRTKS